MARLGPNLTAVGAPAHGVEQHSRSPNWTARGVPCSTRPAPNAPCGHGGWCSPECCWRAQSRAGAGVRARPRCRHRPTSKARRGRKKAYAGVEFPGHVLGVVGLGKIGSLVADMAIKLGMKVMGYDPEITVDAAWSLPSQVRRAGSIEELLRASHFVSLHVPLVEKTRRPDQHQVDRGWMHNGAVLLISRATASSTPGGAESARGTPSQGLCDGFSDPRACSGQPGVVRAGRIWAPPPRGRGQLRVMVVDQSSITSGTAICATRSTSGRLDVARVAVPDRRSRTANAPDMLAQISHAMGSPAINIHNMLNSRAATWHTRWSTWTPCCPQQTLDDLRRIRGVLAVRYLPAEG